MEPKICPHCGAEIYCIGIPIFCPKCRGAWGGKSSIEVPRAAFRSASGQKPVEIDAESGVIKW